MLAWLIPDFSGIFCIIFCVRRGFRGGGYIMPLLCAAMSRSDICIRHDTYAEILRRGVKRGCRAEPCFQCARKTRSVLLYAALREERSVV